MVQDDEKRIKNEEEAISRAFQDILDIYLASQHRKKVELITKAFNFARQAHKGVRRHSGEPYIMHPLAVARIVCAEIGLGSTSICAALLHDVVEDTDYTVEDIRNLFGEKIAMIVDGLTKISGGVFGMQASEQAENFKKLLLTMSEDIRVILIKIADRLHNMRTLEFMPVNKQYKIAGETLYIYAPIAYRLGLSKIKTELENLSFRYEHPEEYAKIEKKIEKTQQERDVLYSEFTTPISDSLKKMGCKFYIIGRVKSPYSIWNKMQKKHVAFEDIYDILAVRIIFTPKDIDDENNECFKIYNAITRIYDAHPDRLRDWLNKPRANGYRALHATFMSKRGEWIEVQIRSERMNEVAEQGIAAHWKYKNQGDDATPDSQLDNWLHTIKEILDDPQPNALDFLDTIKLNLFATEIFVFTPKGEIKTMPQNCTALDLAYSIHTFLGNHCIGAKVNHRLVPLNHILNSGDQVEILTSNSQHVDAGWLNFVTTAKARTKIQAALRRQKRILQREGEEKLQQFLEKEELGNYSNNIEKIWKRHNLDSREQLLEAIGSGTIVLGSDDKDALLGNKKFRFPTFSFFGKGKSENKHVETPEHFEKIDRKQTLSITDDSLHHSYIIADCCHPIPGDDVLGYYDEENRIVIHKRKCPIADTLKSSHGDRILAANWDTHRTLYFQVPILIKGIDSIGILNQITTIIYQELNVGIQKLTIESKDGIFEGTVWVNVHDVEEVHTICNTLKKIKNIQTIARID
ncbi:MAG: bifunctional (p)ppGpp synthetase/guanosine-3',5'-bis(diphosphate) 3'-pyrophosphohydrolase [Bacteroidaceae bacterium]|nr:bifunctional (p)ppGpp synthetase/guanosine-3',5'-bis(diphosphate) 3'-pyrophosphohydrolase [Bacteroidaceae bacterium]